MYIFSVRLKSSKITPLELVATSIVELATLLENSKDVINFKVGDGIKQEAFGCNGFTKWVVKNFPESD